MRMWWEEIRHLTMYANDGIILSFLIWRADTLLVLDGIL